MSKKFAEKIIDSMVDENGFCGPRGLSVKQFNIISECLKDLEVSQTYKLSGTVKKLDEFNGVKQTILTRCRLKL